MLQKFKTAIISTALVCGVMSQPMAADAPAAATQSAAQSMSLAVVDTQIIFDKSTAIVKVRDQLDKKADEFKKDSTDKEAYFKKKYEELEKQKAVLAKDAFEKKSADLNKEFGDAQKKVQENRNALDKAYMEAMQQFEKTLTEVVQEEAKKINAKIVLPKMQAVFADSSLDITTPVLDSLNKKLPSITVKM